MTEQNTKDKMKLYVVCVCAPCIEIETKNQKPNRAKYSSVSVTVPCAISIIICKWNKLKMFWGTHLIVRSQRVPWKTTE